MTSRSPVVTGRRRSDINGMENTTSLNGMFSRKMIML